MTSPLRLNHGQLNTDAPVMVATTTGSRDEAQQIAAALVERRLAACVQVGGPITSTYRWQGKVETGEEWVCTAKTLYYRYAAVEQTIRELHSYDEPEILVTTIEAGSKGYLRWLAAEVRSKPAN
ncbi:MAG: divalent-cation tolerance protein CutA [Pirellulaceae bacterium]